MRTEEIWEQRVKGKVIQRQFSPRLQRDLETLPAPKELPEIVDESVYIHGPTHYGKTVYAAHLLLQEEKRIYLNNLPLQCCFKNTEELFQELKASFDGDAKRTSSAILDFYQNVHLLVLDDFGASKPTDWIYQILYLIVNHRYEYLLPTIYTANHSLEEVALILQDDRITSRIERQGKVVKKRHF